MLVVVDDAPWVDAASLEALRFAARRLDADRVGFLFAARERVRGAVRRRGIESLAVGGLDTAEAVDAGRRVRAAAAVDASVALALAAAGAAHPLWLREAARELTPEQMTGAAPLTDRVPRAGSVQAAFVRLALASGAGPPRARRAGGRRAGAGRWSSSGRWPISASPPDALEAGIDCGLAQLEAGRPRFSHPLACAAVLEVAEPAQRRLAHEALARAWSEAGEPERAAWHLAAAGDGPDAHVSSALAQVAARRPRPRRARRGGRGLAAGDRDRARRRAGSAAPRAGARPRAGGPRRRGARRARRDPRPRAATRSCARTPRSCRASS